MRLRRPVPAAAVLALSLAAAGCSIGTDGGTSSSDGGGASASKAGATATAPAKKVSAARVASNLKTAAQSVPIDHKVTLRVSSGTFTNVSVSGPKGALPGRLSPDKTSWRSTGLLQPDQPYTVKSAAVDTAGLPTAYNATFHTAKLTKDQQTYPSFYPTGGTYGIGMPVVIKFDIPVTDKASIERHLQVVSSPAQVGSFYWVSDNEVHWRPRHYWQPGTKVTVRANVAGVPAGKMLWGQTNRSTSFNIGNAAVDKVSTTSDELRHFDGGKLTNTIPITTGMPGFTTRSGTKVILEKDRFHDMNSETIGIDPNGPLGYNLKGVEYAMRLTYSGEFLHAAPWSVGSQGHSNVSHGCTGMSTSNAAWLFDHSQIGDPVEYTGTDKQMTLTNGFGDWNLSWPDYRAGSALH